MKNTKLTSVKILENQTEHSQYKNDFTKTNKSFSRQIFNRWKI